MKIWADIALETHFGPYEKKKKKKKIEKKIEKKFFLVKNPKFLMGSKFFLSSIKANLVPQNDILWFF